MDIKKEIEKLESSDNFRRWQKTKDAYLVHIFASDDVQALHIGYYCKKDDLISTFVLEDNSIKQLPDSEALKEKKSIIRELDLSKVKISFDKAREIAEKEVAEKYPREVVFKRIFILQHLDTQVWNITAIAKSFNTINLKIDALTGKVLFRDCFSLRDSVNLV